MQKTNVLQAALNRVPESPTVTPEPQRNNMAEATKPPVAKSTKPSRKGTVMIGGHFPPSIKQQLRMIAAEEGTTSQALLEEALQLLFVKKGKSSVR